MPVGSTIDYLRTIHDLLEQGTPVVNVAIARALKVRPASVTGMMNRLVREGLMSREVDRRLRLTAKGRRMAQNSIRRHRLVETWLIRSLHMDWATAHEEAHHMEHAVSSSLEAAIAKHMGDPSHDPHGAPIPDARGRVNDEDATPLESLKDGEEGAVVRLSDRHAEKLAYWSSLGLVLGASVRRTRTAEFGGPVELAVEGTKALVGEEALHGVWVRRVEDGDG